MRYLIPGPLDKKFFFGRDDGTPFWRSDEKIPVIARCVSSRYQGILLQHIDQWPGKYPGQGIIKKVGEVLVSSYGRVM